VLQDLAAGFRLIRHERTLRLLLPVFAAVNLFVLGILAVGVPTVVKEALLGDAKALGLVTGSFGVGLMMGTALMNRLPSFLTTTLAGLFTLFALSDGFLGLTGLAPTVPFAGVTLAISGFFIGPASAVYQSVIQTTTPPEFLGRVTSASRAISFGLEPASASLVGAATNLVSAAAVVAVGGLAATCIDVSAILRGRRLDTSGAVKLPGAAVETAERTGEAHPTEASASAEATDVASGSAAAPAGSTAHNG
jgi:transmembrane secretion effector